MINGNFISIVGGAGHVGTPLGLALSSKGYNVILIDKNKENIKKIDLFIKKHNFSIVNFSYDKVDPFFNINSYRELDKAKKLSIS